jgi:predicted metal-dependent HD superfamily phosphohydrolase
MTGLRQADIRPRMSPHPATAAPDLTGLLPPPVLADLLRRHAEPHRVHHVWASVAERLALAEEVLGGIADKLAFILAILFRHAVCDPRRGDNAAESATLLLLRMRGALPPARLARAAALIHAADRATPPDTADPSLRGDGALLADIDAAILGAPPARYAAYEAALRQEAAHMTADVWRAGRASVLQMLLWRDRLYRTDRFFLAHERQARRNIGAQIAALHG